MPILDEILGFFRKPRQAVSEQTVPTVIKVQIDLARIHDKRHIGPGIYGYSWEENAAIGVMNNLVAVGIPMDWKHFITWAPTTGRRDSLAFERFMPSRGRITVSSDPDFSYRGSLLVTWTDA